MTDRAPSPSDVLDELLVLRAQAGDGDAMERLVGRWQARLVAYARRLVGTREDARDVVQDAWVGVVRGLARLEDPRRFGAFARCIVARRAADASRRPALEVAPLLDDPPAGAGEEPPPGVERLRRAIAALRPDRRALLALRYREGLDEAAISRLLRVPVGTIKSRLHHVRAELRSVMERT